MQKRHSRQEKQQRGCGFVTLEREQRSNARLVVILQEVNAFSQELAGTALQECAQLRILPAHQVIVELFVVRVIESALLQLFFTVPIYLGDQFRLRLQLPNRRNCLSPEIFGRLVRGG